MLYFKNLDSGRDSKNVKEPLKDCHLNQLWIERDVSPFQFTLAFQKFVSKYSISLTHCVPWLIKKLFFELKHQSLFYHRSLKILWLVYEAISLDFKQFVLELQFSIHNPVALGDRASQLSKSVDFM